MNRAVTHVCKLEILQLIFIDAQQNRKFLSKISSKIGKKYRIAGKKNKWEKKQNRLIPNYSTNTGYTSQPLIIFVLICTALWDS